MRFHVLSLRHTSINDSFSSCAYSIQTRNFVRMMAARGHEVILYSNKNSSRFDGVEQVDLFETPMTMSWNVDDWQSFNALTIKELSSRLRDGDFILTMAGICQKQVAAAFPQHKTVEYGIGYDVGATFARYRVYVSNAHREWCLGYAQWRDDDSDSTAIHCSFDLEDFKIDHDVAADVRRRVDSGDYILFIGRPKHDKGFDIADEVSQRLSIRLVIAGDGFKLNEEADAKDVTIFGRASIAERNVLMRDAVAILAPTLYREPFGCVAVEAQLCRTPAITTDVGGFTETVAAEWRCGSVDEFCAAALRAKQLTVDQRRALAFVAAKRFGFDTIAPQYERFFARIGDE